MSAATADLTFRELLDYTAEETARWAEYGAAHPQALDFPFAAGRDARARLERFVETASDDDLARRLTFETISAGTQSASARKIVGHALLHAVRTWAQLATVVRQHGAPTRGRHDLLLSDALV